VPTNLRNGYGLFFTDSIIGANDIDNYVEMSVLRTGSNQLVIRLQHQDFVLGTQTFVDSTPLVTGHDEIALTLTRGNASSNAITGSFAYIDLGVMGPVTTFASTASILAMRTSPALGLRPSWECQCPSQAPSFSSFPALLVLGQ